MPLQIIRQDITKMRVDAIVNTTNAEMVGYSGVDLAVHNAAGPALERACAKLVPLAQGSAKITKGYGLDAKYIIHTVGPIWRGGTFGEIEVLRSCYLESLKLAVEKGCRSVAFPLISSGNYGFPKDQVLKFAVRCITEFLFENEINVYLCVFDRTSYEFSKKLFSEIKDFVDDKYAEERFCHRFDCDFSMPAETMDRMEFTKPKMPGRGVNASRKAEEPMPFVGSVCGESLQDYMKKMDKSFADKLFDLIDQRGMTDVECYKKANVDKKTFSKIKCNPKKYKPSKQTAVAFAIALHLSLDETQELLAAAGLTLSRSFTFDKIIIYFLQNGVYDIFEINQALFEFDQVLLGC